MRETLLDVEAALNGLGHRLHFLAGKCLLLTGARGYLGRYVVSAIIEANKRLSSPCHIIALDSFITGNADRSEWMNIPNLTFMEHDVRHTLAKDMSLMSTDPAKRIDFVLHMAGIASPHWYKKMPLETIAVSVDGSRTMLEIAKFHNARYLFTSSSELYQTATINPTPESYVGAVPTMTDRSAYDVGKMMGETLSYVYAQKGVHTVTLRIFNSFGPGMSEKDRRILPVIASAMVRGKPVTVFQNRERAAPKRTYTPVANTLLGLLLVLIEGEKGQVYNVGLDSPEVTVQELVERIAHVTRRDVRCTFESPPEHYQTEPLRRCPDITKLKGLGFRPVVDLDTGLKRFADWALATYTGRE